MADQPKHKDKQDQAGFSKGKKEAPKRKINQPKSTAKTREASRSKGGSRERG
jgi:hypothetical protein